MAGEVAESGEAVFMVAAGAIAVIVDVGFAGAAGRWR